MKKKVIEARSLFEFVGNEIATLEEQFQQTNNSRLKEEIAAIEYYSQVAKSKSFIRNMRSLFDKLYAHIDKEMPSLLFELSGRKKAWASFFDKMQMLLENNRSLASSYRDIFGYSLITLTSNEDSKEEIENLYKAMELAIRFFMGQGMTLCNSETKKDIDGFNAQNYPDIFVPDKSLLSEKYRYGVKDYVVTPKKNGYQGLQAIFQTKANTRFEVQFKTLPMHIRATHGSASHNQFKNATREITEWEITNSHIPGLNCIKNSDGNEIIDDHIGFIKPLTIFYRAKTF